MSSRFASLVLFLVGLACLAPAEAFVPISPASSGIGTWTVPSMSSAPMDEKDNLGATERLLLERAYQRDNGLVQEYGRTIKKDGLDGVRAAVWGLFHASQAVFSVLAVALVLGMALNAVGYAYYFDDTGIHVESFHHLEQMRFLEAETARLAATAERSVLVR